MNRASAALCRSFFAVSLLTVPMSGCSFFDEASDVFGINIPITIPIPVPLPIVYPSVDQLDGVPTGVNGSRTWEIPAVYASNINLSDYSPSISGNSIIDSIEITSVTLKVNNNTLEVPIEPIEIRVGDGGGTYETALPAARTAQLAAGFTGEHVAVAIPENQAAVGDILAGLNFGIGMQTQLVIPADFPGGGQATVQLELKLRVRIAP